MTTQTQSDAARKIDRQYCTGLISAEEAIGLLVARCGMTQEQAEKQIRG